MLPHGLPGRGLQRLTPNRKSPPPTHGRQTTRQKSTSTPAHLEPKFTMEERRFGGSILYDVPPKSDMPNHKHLGHQWEISMCIIK
ncbi:hypothetical protein HDV57DRAFT_382562 [Trichoderma longibrachiatum]